MNRFTWSQAKEYWQNGLSRAGEVDEASDPDALGNVCHAGAPMWFNEYYARYQRVVFEELLAAAALPAGARALDVGCGGGRWCRLLAAKGLKVEGIDLQPALIERNRRKYPDITFHCMPIQELVPEQMFDLVTTVTVIQHIPFEDQPRAIEKIGSIVKPGGYVLTLENIADQGVHVFANAIDGWTRAFGRVGFKLRELRRYDYSPAIRLSSWLVAETANLARRLGVMRPASHDGAPRAPTAGGGDSGGALRRAVRSAGWASRRLALTVDDRVEPLLVRLNLALPTVHCGFLFQKAG